MKSIKEKILQTKKGTMDNSIPIGAIVLIVVTLILGIALLPVITGLTAIPTTNGTPVTNLSATGQAIIGLIPLFYTFLLIAVVVLAVVVAFRRL